MSNATRTTTKKGRILVNTEKGLYKNANQKEKSLTAEIKQSITSTAFYPGKRVTSDLQGNIFGAKDFGYDESSYDSVETRVAWLDVPEDKTIEQVQVLLDAALAKGACIYRILDSEPILTKNQDYALTRGKTMDDYANQQVLKYPAGNDKAGQIIPDANGNPTYRRTFYWPTAKADVDRRDSSRVYMSPEIATALMGAGILQDQDL